MKARRVKVFVLIIPVKGNLGYYLLIPQNSLPVKSDPASEPGRDSGQLKPADPQVLRKCHEPARMGAVYPERDA